MNRSKIYHSIYNPEGLRTEKKIGYSALFSTGRVSVSVSLPSGNSRGVLQTIKEET